MNCPLPSKAQSEALDLPLKSLIPKCRNIKCSFVDSDHDSDYLPGNCVLFVVAMINNGPKQSDEKARLKTH